MTKHSTLPQITITDHDKREWSRLAADAYATGRNFYGHRYSAHAALPHNATLSVAVYDTLQWVYRRWLIGGWTMVEQGSN